MLVDKILELPDGKYRFHGELSKKEVDVVITVGLSTLLAVGAMPYAMAEDGTISNKLDDEDTSPRH